MASTFLAPDWLDIKSAAPPGKSANPVLRLKFDGLVLWLKVSKGGERVAFAGTVMARAGFGGSGTRILRDAELGLAFQVLGKIGETNVSVKNVLERMDEELRNGGDAILLEDVVGSGDYRSYIEKEGGGALSMSTGWATHAAVVNMESTQRDLARMMAADMILGNYDRMAVNTADGTNQFNAANFIYNAATGNFLPIDNDTVAPSLKHVRTRGNALATQEDLYRVAIHGGILADDDCVFPQAEQGSLDVMLGAEANVYLERCLKNFYRGGYSAEDEAIFKTAAARIAPMVKEELRQLLRETKTPGGDREGLFRIMKSYRAIEGMNYSVFKVKCKFADLVVNNNASTENAASQSVDYGLYRDWKDILDEVSTRPLPSYKVPVVRLQSLGFAQKFKRTVNTAASHVGVLDKSDLAVKAAADAIKKSVRSGRDSVEVIRSHYEAIKDQPDTDNRIIKAKILVIGTLIRQELTEMEGFFQEVIKRQTAGLAARFYAKAIRKKELRFHALWAAYRKQIQDLERHMDALSKDEAATIGPRALASLVDACARGMTSARHAA